MDIEQMRIRMGEMAAEIERLTANAEDWNNRWKEAVNVGVDYKKDVDMLTLRLSESANHVHNLESENARLQSIIDEANAQGSVGYIDDYTLGMLALRKGHQAHIFSSSVSARIAVYARPIPSQQSPAVGVPSTLCKKLEIVSRKLEESGFSVMKNTVDLAISVLASASITNETAVAVPDSKLPQTLSNARAPRAGEAGIDPRIIPTKFTDEQIKAWFGGIKPFCHARKSERGIFATTNDFGASDPLYTIGQVAEVLSSSASSPRITEHGTDGLLPLHPIDHPDCQVMIWSEQEIAAIKDYAKRCIAALPQRVTEQDALSSIESRLADENISEIHIYKDLQHLKVIFSGDYLGLYDKDNTRVAKYKLEK